MAMETNLHLLAKRALRCDYDAAFTLIDLLWRYRDVRGLGYIAYCYVYQIAMNCLIDLASLCRQCGGLCCRSGPYIPIYRFDVEELQRVDPDVRSRLVVIGNELYLPRPCPYQRDWMCTVHKVKPYACLSYPFATEDEQIEYIRRYSSIGNSYPDIYAPKHCLAAMKVKEIVDGVARELEKRLGRIPTPRELLETLLRTYGDSLQVVER